MAHGYTVCDGFIDAAAVQALSTLVRSSLAARAQGQHDGIPWTELEPRHARSDVSTWVVAGARPATDGVFTASLLPALARLEADLALVAKLRGVRELQLASYAAGGKGYKRHTDALAEADFEGSQRKITASAPCSPAPSAQ